MRAAAQRTLPVQTPAPRVGRPPRVSAQAIIEAAIAIGLEGVTLKQVADRLGVAVATLYRHVRNRDELVRLAAFRIALTRRLPQADQNRPMHWSQIAIGYAESLFESFVREPQLLYELTKGRLGPDVEVDFLEQFLAALAAHGFSADEGIRLHHAIAMLAIGASAGALAVSACAAAGEPLDAAMRRALAERDRHELPHLRSAIDAYTNVDPRQWLFALRALLAGIALARGETLPPWDDRFSSPTPTPPPASPVDVRSPS
ncbi:transcriptional regulator, TetR family [Fontimonas thermophila]|uniref:Transcriptional regulator, TetR family n=1 Tax=Fontimonas thermophila TaxID=1076937 RepID=A0A1I2JDZ3_9GAMM|nr:TetR/AcrR family transcriptional regulator [Fontimonas thermophila]SFF51076.1 transcriptional regulator, TetR family [Fontimonas thermophila]